jgi:hypothetical protein
VFFEHSVLTVQKLTFSSMATSCDTPKASAMAVFDEIVNFMLQPVSTTDMSIDLMCSAAEALDAEGIIESISNQAQLPPVRSTALLAHRPVLHRRRNGRSGSSRLSAGIIKRAPAKQANLATLRHYSKVTKSYGKHRVEWSATDIEDYHCGWSLDSTQEPFPDVDDVPISDLY